MLAEKTVTYIARPSDSRCQWWSAIVKPEHINVQYLEERADFTYLKRGADLELHEGSFLIDSEANHHRKNRGYSVTLGYVMEGKVWHITPTLVHKKYIKEHDGQDLMKGSGDVTGCIRMAIWISRQPSPHEAFKALWEVKV